jgi:hypothetical protein
MNQFQWHIAYFCQDSNGSKAGAVSISKADSTDLSSDDLEDVRNHVKSLLGANDVVITFFGRLATIKSEVKS